MAKIIDFKTRKELLPKETEYDNFGYYLKIMQMDKQQLLEEMVDFQEKRSKVPELTTELIADGIILFRELERQAETDELRELAGSYWHHLELEQQWAK